MEIFENLNKEGRTIIMVTHEIDLAERTHRIIKLKDGEIIEDLKKI
jgi:ABC-type antimicrobial peptide transport system, ATPase component